MTDRDPDVDNDMRGRTGNEVLEVLVVGTLPLYIVHSSTQVDDICKSSQIIPRGKGSIVTEIILFGIF